MNEKVDVKDRRKKHWLWINYDMLHYISRTVGPSGLMVYTWLCYHVDWDGRSQECWPSVDVLSEKANITRKTVIEALKELEKFHVISVKRTGRCSVYTLLDMPEQGLAEKVILNELSSQMEFMKPENSGDLAVKCKNYTSDVVKTTLLKCKKGDIRSVKKDVPIIYQEPSTKSQLPRAEASPVLIEALKKVDVHKFNIYQLLEKYKQIKRNQKLIVDIPEDVILLVVRAYLDQKDRIRGIWPWFMSVLDRELGNYCANKNIAEHDQIKKSPLFIGNILQEIANNSKVSA